jgi:glycosyltransferase involved in cell wall biosynthesis
MSKILSEKETIIETDLSVSIIVPCYNEENTIRELLESICQQTYPLEKMEVIIADGKSEDHTREKIQEFQQSHPQIHLKIIDNPRRIIPSALNLAIQAASGEIILRLDAHCHPMHDYVARSVEDLLQGKGKNVGGLWIIRPGAETWIAKSIAISASHPLAVGDARYRYSNQEGSVDTVPFGAFWKDYLVDLGGYNDELLTNEDYELNTRIRKRGDIVWFDPNIRSIYYSRPTISGLAKQYWRYGYWKCKMLKKFPGSLRLRQAIPPLFVAGWLFLGIAAIFSQIFQLLLALMVLLYILALLVISLPAIFKEKDLTLIFGLPISIATMHFCWGAGFLWSLFR